MLYSWYIMSAPHQACKGDFSLIACQNVTSTHMYKRIHRLYHAHLTQIPLRTKHSGKSFPWEALENQGMHTSTQAILHHKHTVYITPEAHRLYYTHLTSPEFHIAESTEGSRPPHCQDPPKALQEDGQGRCYPPHQGREETYGIGCCRAWYWEVRGRESFAVQDPAAGPFQEGVEGDRACISQCTCCASLDSSDSPNNHLCAVRACVRARMSFWCVFGAISCLTVLCARV